MTYCSQCGEILKSNNFCLRCGKNSTPHLPNEPLRKEDLQEVTGAVRAFHGAASEEAKEKKYGQQKWGLFETHYQRSKGITLEESLQEIERFCSEGITMEEAINKLMESQPQESNVGGEQYRQKLAEAIEKKREQDEAAKAKKERRRSSGRSLPKFSAAPTSRPSAGGVPPSGQGKFAPTTNSGAAFFQQFKQKEDAKYKPQHR